MDLDRQRPIIEGNNYQNIDIGGKARVQLGNINGLVTLNGNLILINPRVSRVEWQTQEEAPSASVVHRPLGNDLVEWFLTCVERLEVVQLDGQQSAPHFVNSNRLNNLIARLTGWGWGCGLQSPSTYNEQIDSHPRRTQIVSTLRVIAEQVTTDMLSGVYGLVKHPETLRETTVGLHFGFGKFSLIKNIWNSQKEVSAGWKIIDEVKFNQLLKHLREFVEDLEAFTRDLSVAEKQRHHINVGISSISDEQILAGIASASVGNDDPVSAAASVRLVQLQDQSFAGAAESTYSADASRGDHAETNIETTSILSDETFLTAQSHLHIDTELKRLYVTEDSLITTRRTEKDDLPIEGYVKERLVSTISQYRFSADEIASQKNRYLGLCKEEATLTPTWSLSNHRVGNVTSARRVWREVRSTNLDYTAMIFARLVDHNIRDLLCAFLGPDDTPYAEGIFFTRWYHPDLYPFTPPIAKFLTRIYHPNIDARGRICMDTLTSEGFSPALSLGPQILSLASILDEPNIDDPLVPEIAQQYREDKNEYEKIAKSYTKRFATGDMPELEPYDETNPWWRGMQVTPAVEAASNSQHP